MALVPKVPQRKLRRGPGNRRPNTADLAARAERKQRRNRVFNLIVSGASRRDVARELGISPKQVGRDLERALSEIGTATNAQNKALYTSRLEAVLIETHNAIRPLRTLANPGVDEDGKPKAPDIAASRALALHTRTLNQTIARLESLNIARVDKVLHEHGGIGGGPIKLTLNDVLETMSENETGVDAERPDAAHTH
jgi:DNA-binding CsgD family transcriptional regulator